MNSKSKTIAYVGIFTALYVVLGAFCKIPFIGNISLDLGYIAFAFALYNFGYAGIIVGVIGCSLESILFSAYGFSIGWAIGNLVIGTICAILFAKNKKKLINYIGIGIAVLIGIVVVKTAIECQLYSIPILVKLPKSILAFCLDTITMEFGLLLGYKLKLK